MKRVVPGILMALGCLALLIWGNSGLIQTVVVCVAAGALVEYFNMTLPGMSGPFRFITILCALFPTLFAFSGTVEMVMAGTFSALLGLVIISLKADMFVKNGFAFLNPALFGTLYISVTLAHLGLIACRENGNWWLLILLALIAGSDTGAYYFGKKFGRKKLCPTISPKKTIAGAVGGIATGTVGALCALLFLPLEVNLVTFVLPAMLLIVIGILGDLSESTMKRSYDIKDSGTILAGHGGLLDRIDSLLLSAPALYYLLALGVFA